MQYGHFDNEKREYVIDRVDLPVSWTNYLGVKDLCVVVNHTAGGYMFYQSPEYHRVTRFRGNAVPMDRPGHYVYLRDAEDGDYWSISWQPVGKPLNQAKYTCRHGMSYTTYECDYKGIKASQTLMVPMDDAVELWDVRLKNTTDKERRLSVFSYCEFSFHHIMIDNQNFQMSLYCAGSSYDENIIEYDLFYEEFGYQYFASNVTPDGFDCLRDSFLGAYRTEDNPIAVECGTCSGSHELGNNHCGSLQKDLVLAPGEEVRLIFMLGEGSREAGKKIREKYSDMANVDAAYAQLREYWENKFAQLQIRTPNEGMNTLINTWNLYQAEVNIMFSRFASFIEEGGRTGLGYRDTAQDAMTIPHSNPEKCRQRIVELLRGLTTKGYGLHLFSPEWFDPDAKKEKKKPFKSPTVIPTVNAKDIVHGLADACSDDARWLVPSIIEYIEGRAGETGFADETVTYADGGEGTVYEHMKRILDFSAGTGRRNRNLQGTPRRLERLSELRRRRERDGLPPALLGDLPLPAGHGTFSDARRMWKNIRRCASGWAEMSVTGNCGIRNGSSAVSQRTERRSEHRRMRKERYIWSPMHGQCFPVQPMWKKENVRWIPWISICLRRMEFCSMLHRTPCRMTISDL